VLVPADSDEPTIWPQHHESAAGHFRAAGDAVRGRPRARGSGVRELRRRRRPRAAARGGCAAGTVHTSAAAKPRRSWVNRESAPSGGSASAHEQLAETGCCPCSSLLTILTFWSAFSASCRADHCHRHTWTLLHEDFLQLSLKRAVTCRVRRHHERAGSRAAAAGSDKALQRRSHSQALMAPPEHSSR
jgi:hypothetical protein